MRLAAETGAEVELLTNGTLLSEEMIRGLIEAGLCKLWVSIDDLQTDSSIDGSGHDHAGQVLSNIRRFNRIRQQHGDLMFNGQSVLRRTGYCKFVREGMTFLRSDGKVCPCMALLHNGYTWMNDVRRKITYCAFGTIREQGLSEIWNSPEYRSFRRKFDDFDFASCLYCGHCELFAENKEDCIGNTHPTCGGCLWAEGVRSCP